MSPTADRSLRWGSYGRPPAARSRLPCPVARAQRANAPARRDGQWPSEPSAPEVNPPKGNLHPRVEQGNQISARHPSIHTASCEKWADAECGSTRHVGLMAVAPAACHRRGAHSPRPPKPLREQVLLTAVAGGAIVAVDRRFPVHLVLPSNYLPALLTSVIFSRQELRRPARAVFVLFGGFVWAASAVEDIEFVCERAKMRKGHRGVRAP